MTRCRALPILLLALGTLPACSEVRSLAPAIEPAHAVEVANLLGRWEIRDTAVLEIRRITGMPKGAYLLELEDLTDTSRAQLSARAGDRRRTTPVWFEALAGQLAGHLLLELTPDRRADRSLAALHAAYVPRAATDFAIVAVQADSETLRFELHNADSLQAVTPMLLRRPECSSPTHFLGRGHLVLAGTSAEARAAYECLLRDRGLAKGATVFQRQR